MEKQKDKNFVNLALKCGAAVNVILMLGYSALLTDRKRPLWKHARDIKLIVYRYFPLIQRMVTDFLTYDLKQSKGVKQKEESKLPFNKTQLSKKPILEKLLLGTIVGLCTEYDTSMLKLIERSTWEVFTAYFLAFRKAAFFQRCYYQLVTAAFSLSDETLVFDVVLYQNMIGELWEIIQQRERDILVFKEDFPNRLFYHISMHLVKLLEDIEDNGKKYPIMRKQFEVNLAWKKIREYRGREPGPSAAPAVVFQPRLPAGKEFFKNVTMKGNQPFPIAVRNFSASNKTDKDTSIKSKK